MVSEAGKLLQSAADKAEQKYIATEATKFDPAQAKQRLLDSVRVNYTQEDTTGAKEEDLAPPVPVDSVDKQVAGMIQLASGFDTSEEFYKAVQDRYIASGLNPNTIGNIAPLLEQSWEASRGVESNAPSQDTPVDQTAAVGAPVLSQAVPPVPVLTPKQEAVVVAKDTKTTVLATSSETKKEVLVSATESKKQQLDPTYTPFNPLNNSLNQAINKLEPEPLDDAEVAALEQKRVEEIPVNPAFAKKFKGLDTQQVSRGEFLRSQIGKNDFTERELIDQYDALRLQQVNQVKEEDDGFFKEHQNIAAFVDGTGRLVGDLLEAPITAIAGTKLSGITDEDTQLIAQHEQNTTLQKELGTLKKLLKESTDPKRSEAIQQRIDSTKAQIIPLTEAGRDRLFNQGTRGIYRDSIYQDYLNHKSLLAIASSIDSASKFGLVDDSTREALQGDLGVAADIYTETSNRAAALSGQGKHVAATAEQAKAFALTAAAAGEALLSNPGETFNYLVENIPQLLFGSASKVATLFTTSSYGVDVMRDAYKKYEDENGGLPPTEEQRTKLILAGMGSVALEFVGDRVMLDGLPLKIKPKGNSPAEALAAPVTDTLQKDLKEKLLSAGTSTLQRINKTGGTILGAAIAESGVEGGQAGLEGFGKEEEVTAKEVVPAAAIGGAIGGGFRAGSSVVQGAADSRKEATAARIKKVVGEAEKSGVLTDAVTTGDFTTVADKEAEGYDLVTATKAYLLRNQAEGVTPEEVTKNEAEIQQLHVDAIEAQMAQEQELLALNEAGKVGSKEYKAALKKKEELAEVTTNIGNLRTAQEETTSLKGEELTAVLETVEAATEDTPEFRNASQRLVNDPNLDTPTLERLVANKNIPFTPGQEARLRHRLDKQRALDQLKDESEVHQDVIYGGKGKIGLNQYQDKVNSAVVRNKEGDARGALAALGTFASRHEAKVNLIQDAYAEVQGTDNVIQLVPVNTEVESVGKWERAQKVYTAKELKNLGGLRIHRNSNIGDTRFIENLGFEKDALLAGLAESEAIIENAFGPAKNPAEGSQSTQKPTSKPTNTNAPATPKTPPTAPTELEGLIDPKTSRESLLNQLKVKENFNKYEAELANIVANRIIKDNHIGALAADKRDPSVNRLSLLAAAKLTGFVPPANQMAFNKKVVAIIEQQGGLKELPSITSGRDPVKTTPAPTTDTQRLNDYMQEFSPDLKATKAVLANRKDKTKTSAEVAKGEAFALAWFDKNAEKLRKTSSPLNKYKDLVAAFYSAQKKYADTLDSMGQDFVELFDTYLQHAHVEEAFDKISKKGEYPLNKVEELKKLHANMDFAYNARRDYITKHAEEIAADPASVDAYLDMAEKLVKRNVQSSQTHTNNRTHIGLKLLKDWFVNRNNPTWVDAQIKGRVERLAKYKQSKSATGIITVIEQELALLREGDVQNAFNQLDALLDITTAYNEYLPVPNITVIDAATQTPAANKETSKSKNSTTPTFDALPSKVAGEKVFIYAGIGSRNIPASVATTMTALAKRLEGLGYKLQSGGATADKGQYSADVSFEAGVETNKEIFYAKDATATTRTIAREIHPAPGALKPFPLDLMARNTNQVFGRNLDTPVDFVLTWTPDGVETASGRTRRTGGTGQAIEMADRKGIVVINMAKPGWEQKLEAVLGTTEQTSTNSNREEYLVAALETTNYQHPENALVAQAVLDNINLVEGMTVAVAFDQLVDAYNDGDFSVLPKRIRAVEASVNAKVDKALGVKPTATNNQQATSKPIETVTPPTPQETTPPVTEEVTTVGSTEEIERTARDLDAAEQQLQELEDQLQVDFPDSALLITAPDERLDEISELEENIAALQEELDNLSAPAPEAAYDLGTELTTEQVVNPQPSVTKENSFSVFQKLNLVARNFVYKGERDGKAYVNPLNSVRDVVAKMNQGLDFLLEFSKKNDFTAKQIQTLSTFAKKAAKWDNTFLQKVWLALPATQSGFRHRDYIQFLAKDGELDPNVRAAIHLGIYQWLTTQANNLVNNDEEAIASILGVLKERVDHTMVSKLHDMGSYQHVVAAAIGKDIVKALGLKATDFAGTNNQGQLEQSMGMAAINIMLQEGYIQRTEVLSYEIDLLTAKPEEASVILERVAALEARKKYISELPRNEQTRENTRMFSEFSDILFKSAQFIRPAVRKGVDENGVELRYDVVSKEIQDLIDINKDTNGIIPELFSVQEPAVGASLVPFKVKEGRAPIKGNQQKASQEQTDIVNEAGKRKHSLKQNVHKALTFLGYDNLLDIEGYNRTNETTSHVDNIPVVASKNAQIAKGILDHFSFVDSIQTWNDGAGLASPFYFAYDIWSNNRMGMKGSGENIQANKFQRHAVTENSWIEEVSLNPSSESFQRFLLAVGESLGVGTDIQLNTTSFEQISPKLREPVIVTGLEALVAVLTDNVPAGQEAQYQADITAAVNAGGKKTYSLDGLTNYAEYLIARKDPKVKTFTSNLFREVDGKTNGPMLGLIQLAAKGTVEELLEVLESGGFYKPGGAKSFSEWNTFPLNNDIYIKTLGTWVNNVAKKTNTAPLKGYWTGPVGKKTKVNPQSVWRAVGSVLNGTDGDLVRDNVKNPLTITFFGAKDFSIKAQISALFMSKVREQLEDIAANTDRAQAQIDLNNLNYNLALASDNQFNRVIQLDEVLTFTFTKPEETALFFSVVGTYGDTLSDSIEEHYGMFKRTREVANEAIKVVSEGFRLQYDFMVQKKIKELVATGEIPSRIVKGQEEIYGTLSQNQRNEILVEVGKSIPLIANYFSTLSGNTDEHLDLSRSRQATQSGEAYKTTQKTKTKIKGNGADGNPKWTSEASGHSTDLVYRDSGVAPLITALHSTDAAISALVLKAFESLNVHDAHGFAPGDTQAGAKALNKATLDVMSGYSLLSSMRDTLTQSLEALKAFEETHGAEAQVDGKSFSLVIAETVAEDMKEHPQFGEIKVDTHKKAEELLQYMQDLMVYEAANADKKKLEALSQLGHISQYNLEGGQYDLTPEDVATLKKQAEAIVVPDAPVFEQVEEKQTEPSQALIDDETNVSDPDIVSYLSQENPSVSGLIDLLISSFDLRKKGAYNSAQLIRKALLTELKKRMPSDVTVVLVNADNINTLSPKLQKDLKGSLGMYAPATSTIYITEGSGTNSETITHELLHALLLRLLSTTRTHIKNGKTVVPEANEMYKSLYNVLLQAREYVRDKPELLAEFNSNAFANVSEMVSWGMTNAAFQEKVLGAFLVKEPSTNKFISGMTSFIKAIRKYLFKGTAAATSSTAITGLEEVVRLTGGLLKLEGQHRQTYNTAPTPLVAKQTMDQQVYDMTAEELFDGLGQTNTVPSTPAQESRIKAILSGIVTKVHGPFGINYKSAQGTQHATAMDVFLQSLIDKTAQVYSSASVNGFALNSQEAYVLEQIEATMKAGINGTSFAAKDLERLWMGVRKQVKPGHFLSVPWADATQQEQELATSKWNYLFVPVTGPDGRADYLHRFASIGMVDEQFQSILAGLDVSLSRNEAAPTNVYERIQYIFNKILEVISGWVTHVNQTDKASTKLDTLLKQMVLVDTKKKSSLYKLLSLVGNTSISTLDTLVRKTKEGLVSVATSRRVRESSSAVVGAVGVGVDIVLGDKVEALMDVGEKISNKYRSGREGLVAGLVTEARGDHKGTWRFFELLRKSKHAIDSARQAATTNMTNLVSSEFVNAGKDLTTAMKVAVTKAVIRTDMQSLLGTYSYQELERLLSDPAYLDSEITKATVNMRVSFGSATGLVYVNESAALGYMMATGKVTSEYLQRNAHNIYNHGGTTRVGTANPALEAAGIAAIDVLTSLHAIKYTATGVKQTASQVLLTEIIAGQNKGGNLTDVHGFSFVMKMHQRLIQEANEKLFDNNPIHFVKGYTKDITNPHISFVVASGSPAKKLFMEQQGYTQGKRVPKDPTDPNNIEPVYVYHSRDGGIAGYLSGILSQTSRASQGTSLSQAIFQNGDGSNSSMARAHSRSITAARQAREAAHFAPTRVFDPRQEKSNMLLATIDNSGRVTDYRYVMSEEHRDILLERDDRFDKVLGAMAGSVVDKSASKEINTKTIQALHDQYREDFAAQSLSYLEVSATSSDPRLKEIWHMIPDEAKADVKRIWGGKKMLVRKDILDITFGYRKHSVADKFKKEAEERTLYEQIFINVANTILRTNAANKLRRVEDVWQEVVREAKDILVIKNFFTLLGNEISNATVLMVQGVPLLDIIKYKREGFNGIYEYQQITEEIYKLDALLKAGQLPNAVAATEQRLAVLRNKLENNPVKELIDEGVFQAIVEDIDMTSDAFSYKNKLSTFIDEKTAFIPEGIKQAARVVYLSHDTVGYKILNHGTQYSDFTSRYTSYKHLTTRTENRMSKKDALRKIVSDFVAYDPPSSKGLQYGNDSGFVWFSKYYIRIQKPLFNMFKDNPGNAIGLLAAQEFIGDFQAINDSSILSNSIFNRLHNPFTTVLGAPDEIITVNAAMDVMGL